MKLPELEPRTEALTDDGFQGWLHAGGAVVVESYHAGWERPWRALDERGWKELARTFGSKLRLGVIETMGSRDFARRYDLEVIPGVLVFLDGEVIARFTGKVAVGDVVAALQAAHERAAVLREDLAELEVVAERAREAAALVTGSAKEAPRRAARKPASRAKSANPAALSLRAPRPSTAARLAFKGDQRYRLAF